jgi:hypothetical protein
MTQQSNFPHIAAGHKVARWDSTNVDNATHAAARHKPAAASRGELLVAADGSLTAPRL